MQPKTATQLRFYKKFLADNYGLNFERYADVHQWSINALDQFWESIATYFDISFDTPYANVLVRGKNFWETKWFVGSRLSYAQHIFKQYHPTRPAVIYQNELGDYEEINWNQLVSKVYFFQQKLIKSGVKKGDYVVCYGINSPETTAAFLATNALGAIWSSCSPDFGTAAVCDRFAQLNPKVLFAHKTYPYNGKIHACQEKISTICNQIPSINTTIFLDEHASFNDTKVAVNELRLTPVDFSAPIWVLFSSGTTGKPKAIVHGTGQMLLEHLKALVLHQDVTKGDRYFWYSTTGWMMWNYALSSLLCGATLCIYQGAPTYPDSDSLWRFAVKAQIHHFGGGAVYFQQQMGHSTDFLKTADFKSLRTIGSTGSPLSADTCRKLQQQFPSAQIVSLSGGTDVCTAFVGGHPELPVHPGEIQCAMLGAAVEVWNDSGTAIIDEPGELVLTQPLLSMPICLLHDADFTQYQKSYFDKYKTVWNHGDWAKLTPNGGMIIYGRSDATLNRHGVRIGTAELYDALNNLPEVEDGLIIHLSDDVQDKLLLFVQLLQPVADADIKKHIRTHCSPRHVPDFIYRVSEIPYTISGKKVEVPIKRLLMGASLSEVVSLDSLRNPDAMRWFEQFSLHSK